jgi:hypothetical protein
MWNLFDDAFGFFLFVAIPLWLAIRVTNSYLRVRRAGTKSRLSLLLSLGLGACVVAILTLTGTLVLVFEHSAKVSAPEILTPWAIGMFNLVLAVVSFVSFRHAAGQNPGLVDLKKKFRTAIVYVIIMSFWMLINPH